MQNFKRFEETKKIRTISFDTNVLSDAIYYSILGTKGVLGRKKAEDIKRFSESMESIVLALSVNIKTVGIELIKRELKRKPYFFKIYENVFEDQIKLNKEIKQLAHCYTQKIKIENPDALILASASKGKIDIFLSWNRRDIVNDRNLKLIKGINRKRKIHFPIFATPEEFLDRALLTNKLTIGVSHVPIPRQFRLKIF